MSNASLQFGVLGPLQLRVGGALVPLGAPKQRAVLATLLMNRNRAVSVDALIDAVWTSAPVPAARTSIHSYVSNLRRLLGSGSHDTNRLLASVSPGISAQRRRCRLRHRALRHREECGRARRRRGTVRRRQHLPVGCPGRMAWPVSR